MYFVILIIVVFVLLYAGLRRKFGASKAFLFTLIGLSSIFIIVLLLRFGLPHIAAIFSGLLAVAAFGQRILSLIQAVRFFNGFKQNKSNTPKRHMSKNQAYEILGLAPDASKADIKKAHMRLIKKNHPDQGGSAYLAAQLNEAKDILLGE